MDTTKSDVRIEGTHWLDSSLSNRAQSTLSLSVASSVKKKTSLLRSQSVCMPKMSSSIDGNSMKITRKESSKSITSFNLNDSKSKNILFLDHVSPATFNALKNQSHVTKVNADENRIAVDNIVNSE